MRPFRGFQYIAERYASAQSPSFICHSCRNQIASHQRQQFHTASTRNTTIIDPSTRRSFSSSVQRREDTGAKLPDHQDSKKDPSYVEAVSWNGLERVGSDKWLEKQKDKGDKFAGWSKRKTSKKLTTERADAIILEGAMQALDGRGLKNLAGMKDRAFQSGYSDAWLALPLNTARAKFIVAKSITLRTAIRLSDYAVQNITTLGQFRDAMLIRPKPKKTAQKLKISATFDNLPNVSIIDRRVTPIDREKKIGRWKLIEQELLDRGLPVTGQNTKVKQSIVI